MKYCTGHTGRVVVARLEDGDPIYECIESIASKENIRHAAVWVIGGVTDAGVVVGPEQRDARPPQPMVEHFRDAREIVGTGMLIPDATGRSALHLHAGIGRGRRPLVGCPREGATCWLVDEVVLLELTGIDATRQRDAASGFELLQIPD